jgi:hypothetical protein
MARIPAAGREESERHRNRHQAQQDRIDLKEKHEIERGEYRACGAAERRDKIQQARRFAAAMEARHQQAYRIRGNRPGNGGRDEEQKTGRQQRPVSGVGDAVEDPVERRIAEKYDRKRGETGSDEEHAKAPQTGREQRNLPPGEIAHRQCEHEDGDHGTPDVDAVAEAGRQDAPAQELHGHDEKAGPPGEREHDHLRGSTQLRSRRFSGSNGDSPSTVARFFSPRISISIAAPASANSGFT